MTSPRFTPAEVIGALRAQGHAAHPSDSPDRPVLIVEHRASRALTLPEAAALIDPLNLGDAALDSLLDVMLTAARDRELRPVEPGTSGPWHCAACDPWKRWPAAQPGAVKHAPGCHVPALWAIGNRGRLSRREALLALLQGRP